MRARPVLISCMACVWIYASCQKCYLTPTKHSWLVECLRQNSCIDLHLFQGHRRSSGCIKFQISGNQRAVVLGVLGIVMAGETKLASRWAGGASSVIMSIRSRRDCRGHALFESTLRWRKPVDGVVERGAPSPAATDWRASRRHALGSAIRWGRHMSRQRCGQGVAALTNDRRGGKGVCPDPRASRHAQFWEIC